MEVRQHHQALGAAAAALEDQDVGDLRLWRRHLGLGPGHQEWRENGGKMVGKWWENEGNGWKIEENSGKMVGKWGRIGKNDDFRTV